MQTFQAKPAAVEKRWYLVNAADQILGRLASELAKRLRGKHKPEYTPHVDTGDYFVVINAEKIAVTGRKETDKMYYRHSGYTGGIKEIPVREMRIKKPEEMLYLAVKRMLPRNPLGREMLQKLKIYAGDQHPHAAQQPTSIQLTETKAE